MAQNFHTVDEVVIQFKFQQFIIYSYLFPVIGLKYNSPIVSLLALIKKLRQPLLEFRVIPTGFPLFFNM